METKTAIAQLAALAQDTRLAIFRLLMSSPLEGLTVGAIGERLDVAPATLSFHLKELNRAGLIAARQEGRFIFYSAEHGAMERLLRFLSEDCCAGQPCGLSAWAEPAVCPPIEQGEGAACCPTPNHEDLK